MKKKRGEPAPKKKSPGSSGLEDKNGKITNRDERITNSDDEDVVTNEQEEAPKGDKKNTQRKTLKSDIRKKTGTGEKGKTSKKIHGSKNEDEVMPM